MNTIVSVADNERAQILVGAATGNSAASAAAGPTTLWTVAGIVSDARKCPEKDFATLTFDDVIQKCRHERAVLSKQPAMCTTTAAGLGFLARTAGSGAPSSKITAPYFEPNLNQRYHSFGLGGQKMKMPRWVKQQLAADVCILRSYATHAASDSHTHSSFGDLGGPTYTMQLRHGTAARRALLTSATICGGPRSRARVSRAHATQRNWHASAICGKLLNTMTWSTSFMDTESPDGYDGFDFTRCHVRDRLKSTTATLDSSACQFMPLFLSS